MTYLYRLLASSSLTKFLLLLPIAGFFIYFFTLRYNIPWFDDYENIPYFLNRFLQAPSFSEKMAALFRPNNEHRVVYARLVVLVQYFLTGGINFGNLMLWGNAGLVLMICLLYFALSKRENNSQNARIGLLAAPLLLFTAQTYIMTFTAIFSLQYLTIITLVMLTLFVLATNRPLMLALALALGLLSTFSMGNGLLLWPSGAAMLLIQRRWSALGIWIVVGALGGYLYFLGYPVQQGNAQGFSYILQHPFQTIAGFLIFAGSPFDLFPTLPEKHRYYLPFLAGLILVTGLGYWFFKILFRSRKNTLFFETFVFGCLLFLLVNIGLIAFFRIRFYFGMVIHIPYRIYALALWAVASLVLFDQLSTRLRPKIWPAVWLLFVLVNVISYYTYVPEAIERRKHMQGQVFNQRESHIGLGGTRNSNLGDYIDSLTMLMAKKDWYHLPDPAITPDEHKVKAPVSTTTATTTLAIRRQGDYIIATSNEPDYKVGLNTATYLIMKSDSLVYLLFAAPKRPLTINPWRIEPGFSTPMPIYIMQTGRYRLGLLRTYPDHTDIQFGNQWVDVP
ncbi:hypothetical protein GCM10028806_32310 [Spirosoma terrae]|uniref:Glycosyltransferase RgtA/B/C/D-like domain-containing protein n=1 Tax=Spirosoma terrae TaxID=1968276 RepID=A0A6L9L4K1_9BACT|nr:hypothetical protein [Spirosoma terrae]NDU95545.1 hypothetical protein [Spirosoma terrae]